MSLKCTPPILLYIKKLFYNHEKKNKLQWRWTNFGVENNSILWGIWILYCVKHHAILKKEIGLRASDFYSGSKRWHSLVKLYRTHNHFYNNRDVQTLVLFFFKYGWNFDGMNVRVCFCFLFSIEVRILPYLAKYSIPKNIFLYIGLRNCVEKPYEPNQFIWPNINMEHLYFNFSNLMVKKKKIVFVNCI